MLRNVIITVLVNNNYNYFMQYCMMSCSEYVLLVTLKTITTMFNSIVLKLTAIAIFGFSKVSWL